MTEEEDEIKLRAIAASAVNSLLPQAATQQACRSYAEYKCAPLLKRIAELKHSNRAIAETDLRLSAENKRQVARIAELEAALEKSNEAACMGAEIAAAFPVKFPEDWKATPHPLLAKEQP